MRQSPASLEIPASGHRRAYCLSEDRPGAEVGLRLLILSLIRHDPAARIFLYRAHCTPEFKTWLDGVPGLDLFEYAPAGGFDWNCKPQAIQPLLDRGFSEVVWLDSDLLVTGPLGKVLDEIPPEELVITQDSPASCVGEYSMESRTRAWGWSPHRQLPMTLNTCLLRVTSRQQELMSEWRSLLEGERYRRQAALPIDQRSLGFVSDQEVLTALLGSEPFSRVPLRILKTGAEVVHSAGPLSFPLRDRWRWITSGPPVILHATTGKPWNILVPEFASDRRSRLTQLAQEVAPYVAAARAYTRLLPPEERPWLEFRTPAGRLLSALGLGHAALQGLPLSLAAQIVTHHQR